LVVETVEADGELRELLSIVLCFCSSSDNGECRRRRRTRRGRGRAWLVVETMEGGGELLSTVHIQRE
jgi:hypothetical protein